MLRDISSLLMAMCLVFVSGCASIKTHYKGYGIIDGDTHEEVQFLILYDDSEKLDLETLSTGRWLALKFKLAARQLDYTTRIAPVSQAAKWIGKAQSDRETDKTTYVVLLTASTKAKKYLPSTYTKTSDYSGSIRGSGFNFYKYSGSSTTSTEKTVTIGGYFANRSCHRIRLEYIDASKLLKKKKVKREDYGQVLAACTNKYDLVEASPYMFEAGLRNFGQEGQGKRSVQRSPARISAYRKKN